MTGFDPRPVRLIDATRRAYARMQVMAAPDGWIVSIREPTRTLEQNAKFHAMIDDLVAAQLPGREGYDKDMWKAAVLKSLGREMRLVQDLDGVPFYAGVRSSKLTVREMSDGIEIMMKFGAENDVVWSEPEPVR